MHILEYYLRRHARSLRRAYEETIEAIIEDQVYAVDAIKLEYLFENQFKSKVSNCFFCFYMFKFYSCKPTLFRNII